MVEPAIKKTWVYVDSETRKGHNAHGIFEDHDRDREKAEDQPSPAGLKKQVPNEDAGNE